MQHIGLSGTFTIHLHWQIYEFNQSLLPDFGGSAYRNFAKLDSLRLCASTSQNLTARRKLAGHEP